MTQSRVDDMAESMIANQFPWHLTGPVRVAEGPNGVKIILDGHHRTQAAIDAGLDSIPVVTEAVSAERWTQLILEVMEAGGMR